MRLHRAIIIITAVLLASQTQGMVFNDGGIHDVNSWDYYGETISIQNSFWDEPTTVNLLPQGGLSVVQVRDDCFLNVVGGDANIEVQVYQNGTITVTAGEASQIRAYDSSQVIIEDGWMGAVYLSDDAFLRMSGGSVGRLSISPNGRPIIEAGEIRGDLEAQPYSEVYLLGGYIAVDLHAYPHSSAYISCAQIEGHLVIQVDALVTIYGENFLIDQHPVTGVITNPLPEVNYGHLTGQFLNGDPIDLNLRMDPNASITLSSQPGATPVRCLSFPRMDFDKDCKVGFTDLALFLDEWLDCNLEPASACLE